MGLGSKIKLALLASRLYDRLEKEFKMGHGKAVVVGLGGALLTGLAAKVAVDCPCFLDVLKAWPAYLTAGAVAAVSLYMKSPLAKD